MALVPSSVGRHCIIMVVRMLLLRKFPMMPTGQRMAATLSEKEAPGLHCASHLVLWEKMSLKGTPVLLWISRLPIPTRFPAHSPGRTGARGSHRPRAQPSQSYREFSIHPVAQNAASLVSLELLLSRRPGRGLPGPGASTPGGTGCGKELVPPRTGQLAEPGGHHLQHRSRGAAPWPPTQIAVDCLIL